MNLMINLIELSIRKINLGIIEDLRKRTLVNESKLAIDKTKMLSDERGLIDNTREQFGIIMIVHPRNSTEDLEIDVAMVLGESLDPMKLIGSLVCIGGVFLYSVIDRIVKT